VIVKLSSTFIVDTDGELRVAVLHGSERITPNEYEDVSTVLKGSAVSAMLTLIVTAEELCKDMSVVLILTVRPVKLTQEGTDPLETAKVAVWA